MVKRELQVNKQKDTRNLGGCDQIHLIKQEEINGVKHKKTIEECYERKKTVNLKNITMDNSLVPLNRDEDCFMSKEGL